MFGSMLLYRSVQQALFVISSVLLMMTTCTMNTANSLSTPTPSPNYSATSGNSSAINVSKSPTSSPGTRISKPIINPSGTGASKPSSSPHHGTGVSNPSSNLSAKAVSQSFASVPANLPAPNAAASSAHPPVSGQTCRVGILAPLQPHVYGLVDNATFWTTLNSSLSVASDILDGTCAVEEHVRFVSCTLGSTLLAAFSGPFHDVDVLIGPPCSAVANIISLIRSPVVTWIPLFIGLEFGFEGQGQGQVTGQGHDEDGGLAISSFGRYDDLAAAVILTLKHFKWSKIATLCSHDEFCSGFHEVMSKQSGTTQISARHFEFEPRNASTIDAALSSVKDQFRILVTCSNQETFEDLLASAERLQMTSGSYVIVHVTLGTWPLAKRKDKLDYFYKRLSRTVLFVGHFPDLDSRAATPLNATSSVSSSGDTGRFLDYFYDAILLWATAQNETGAAHLPRFTDLNLTGRTGHVQLDKEGVRQRHHCLLHYQGGQVVRVADLSGQFTLLHRIDWPGGHLPFDAFEDSPGSNTDQIIGGVLGTLFVILVLLVAVFLFRRWRLGRRSQGLAWQVEDREVKRRQTHVTLQNGNNPQRRLMRMETRGTLGLGSICSLDRNQLFAPVGNYRGTVVAVRNIQGKSFRLTPDVNTDLNILKELTHDNINTFVGAHVEPGNTYVLFKYCAKGSLQDVLENEDITLDWMFKMSFATDLARGMEYLHKSALKSHGNLKSSNCVIDSRWVLKITDFGAVTSPPDDTDDEMSHHALCNALLWTAPELLRLADPPLKGTQKADVFSFAIVLQEILFRVGPYGYDSSSPEEIVENVKKGEPVPFRPHIPDDHEVHEKALTLMTSCWDETPEQRPEFRVIRKRLFELNGGKKVSMLDNMLSLMETYSSRLEQLVADRTAELAQEKVKTDRLLYQMLPASVAEQLKSGKPVVPEFYNAVSIFFSDIVGFTTIASESKPLEVVDLLNDLYTAFDDVIFRRDVYKVETIGDAYMCVSGCPRRNGQRHASEIAEMALDLVSTVRSVKVRHRPHESLQLRVGLHTGPCAAGVVGVAMPRYCLFGDTVNMASRMESTGKALHIHISSEMQAALEELDCGFMTMERGMIQVKGKGIHKTHWLVGKKGYSKTLPDTFTKLRQTLDETNSRPPSPSNTSLTVGDGMYSALRKTSVAVSHITMTSDSDDFSVFVPGSPVRSESGVDTSFPCPGWKHRNSNDTSVNLLPTATTTPTAQNGDVCKQADDADDKRVTISETADPKLGAIPRIEIS